LIGDTLVDAEAEALRSLVLQDPAALIEALVQSFNDGAPDDGHA